MATIDAADPTSLSFKEKAAVGFAIILIGCSIYFSFSGKWLRYYLFNVVEEDALLTPIGKVIAISGTVTRMRASDTEFSTLANSEKIFPDDTVMTGPNSRIVIELDNGQKIELGSNALNKLSFELAFKVHGLSKKTDVGEMVTDLKDLNLNPEKYKKNSGLLGRLSSAVDGFIPENSSVTVKPKPMPIIDATPKEDIVKKPPVPLVLLSNLRPTPDQTLAFSKEDLLRRKKSLALSFTSDQPPPPLQVTFYSVQQNQVRTELATQRLMSQNVQFSVPVTVSRPGLYEWQVKDILDRVLSKTRFQVVPEVEAIKTGTRFQPNNISNGLQAKKVFEGFELNWGAVDGIGNYIVQIFDSNSQKMILTQESASTKLVINRNKLIVGKMYFTVQRKTAEGFVAQSSKHEFTFEYLPPRLTSPENNLLIDSKALAANLSTVFFTWMKTDFTEYYEFELATNPMFTTPIIHKQMTGNFFSLVAPPPGIYYWRVRSITTKMVPKELSSSFSEPRQFTVQ